MEHHSQFSSLAGQTAIVTGAAGDIGNAIALRLLEAGMCVAWLDLNEKILAARVASSLAPEQSMAVACDIAQPDSVRNAVSKVIERFGSLHILVNNAATVTVKKALADISYEEWSQTFEVNVTGAFLMSKWAIPHLIQTRGTVINIASQLGHVTRQGSGAYSASKAALLGLTRSIAVDYAQQGIRAVSLSPGSIMTSRLVQRYGSEEAVSKALATDHPVGHIGTPDDIAHATLFLASGAARFITGTDLLIDGAYTAV